MWVDITPGTAHRTTSERMRGQHIDALMPVKSKYWPYAPHPRQRAFLCIYDLEALFGGAGGGGKSDCLLMAGLQFAEYPDYSAVLFRRTFKELSSNDGLLPLCQEWLSGTDAIGAETLGGYPTRYDFPSGSVLSFSHMATLADRYQHKGARYDFAGYDELTGFLQPQYTYLFSRLRRAEGSKIPTRMRGATNPGDIGHEWVMQRFKIPGTPHRRRIVQQIRQPDGELTWRSYSPSQLIDNPTMDQDQYRRSLNELDPVDQARMEFGDWSAREMGDMFESGWFDIISKDEIPSDARGRIRVWDVAATAKTKDNNPDYTSGCLQSTKGRGEDQHWFFEDINAFQKATADRDGLIKQQAQMDGRLVPIYVPQDPGAAGKAQVVGFEKLLNGYPVKSYRETGDKPSYAGAMATSAKNGRCHLVNGPWVKQALQQLDSFPSPGVHDDDVNSMYIGYHQNLSKRAGWGDMNYGSDEDDKEEAA